MPAPRAYPLVWRNLAPHWPFILQCAQARENDKGARDSTHAWAKGGRQHLIGLAGEMLYCLHTGADPSQLQTIITQGDGGVADFVTGAGTVQVKAVTYREYPQTEPPHYALKEYVGKKEWADLYVLALVDEADQKGTLLGWTVADELKRGRIVDYGFGPRSIVPASDLRSMVYFPT